MKNNVAVERRRGVSIWDFYSKLDNEFKLRRGIWLDNAQDYINNFIEEENKRFWEEQKDKEEAFALRNNFVNKMINTVKNDFKDPDVKANSVEKLAEHKDKWKKGKKLLELQKQFPHDLIIQRMVKDEFKDTRLLKYPEEYEVYDDEEENRRKMSKYKILGVEAKAQKFKEDEEKKKAALDKFIASENIKQDEIKWEQKKRQAKIDQFNDALKEEVKVYIEVAKGRISKQRAMTQRQFLADVYHRLKDEFPDVMEELFPFKLFGVVKGSNTENKSFPREFKTAFYEEYHLLRNGKKNAAPTRPTFFIPSGVGKKTMNKKIKLDEDVMKKYEKAQSGIVTRLWKRDDYQNDLKEIIMLKDDAENCNFEPNAGSQNLTMKKILSTFPELQRSNFTKESNILEYVDKFGDNFTSSNPEIYKKGILSTSQTHFNAGRIDEAWRRLKDGFNIESLKRYFDPLYEKKKEAKKRREQQRKKAIEEGKIKPQIKHNIEEPEGQRKMREENFEKAKNFPILQEAYTLVCQLEALQEKHKKENDRFGKLIQAKNKELSKNSKFQAQTTQNYMQNKRQQKDELIRKHMEIAQNEAMLNLK